MELLTPRFGSVAFEPQEILVFDRGLQGWKELRQWLLLADAAHARLLWLQSIRRPAVTLPVLAVQEAIPGLRLPVRCDRPPVSADSSARRWVLLFPLREDVDQLSADRQHPILIDTDTHRGTQFDLAREQTLQWVPSEQTLPLRESA